MSDLVARLVAHLEQTQLIPSGARVLVGYSGGADSTCLLHVLHAAGVVVAAAHLHHCQRDEADEEMRRCEGFAGALGVPFVGGKANVPKMSKELGTGLEEAGRRARYEFLHRAALQYRCDLIATAHTRDDHVETVLLNLIRGTGMSGLCGIPMRRGKVVRPFLEITREETRAYCEAVGLWFHDDPANVDPAFSRSRLRLNVIPELRAVNPAADEAVVRMAEILAEEDGFLNGMAVAALEQCEVELNGNLKFVTADCEVAFDRALLTALPAVLVKRGLRLATTVVGAALDRDQTELILQGLTSEPRGSVTAEGGKVVVEWDGKTVSVREVRPCSFSDIPLQAPGETSSHDGRWTMAVEEKAPQDYRRERRSLAVSMDADALKGEPVLRSALDGDALVPLGMKGRKKLSDIFGEAGLTLAARRRLPIVCDMIGPVWVPGLCMADRVKIVESTRRAFELRFGPQSPGGFDGPAT